MQITLSGIEYRLNFENRTVISRDIKGGRKQPPATNKGSQETATNSVKLLNRFTKLVEVILFFCLQRKMINYIFRFILA